MSTLSQFLGGGIKSIQTGFVSGTLPFGSGSPSNSNEDFRYADVAISSVNTSKAWAFLPGQKSRDASFYYSLNCRLTSSTNLRVSNSISDGAGIRWVVVEFN
jgi:hypothetical protein